VSAFFTLAALKALGGRALKWLGSLSFWQLACLALASFALVQHFVIADARHDAVNYRRQRDEYKAQLQAISAKRNEQKVVTRDRIKVVERTIKSADERAKVIEAAPPAPDCKTNSQVLGADL
jgi:hypothetical protein